MTKYAMRRRCFWCCIELKWWQLNGCAICHRAMVSPYVGPPFTFGGRLHDESGAADE